jgi:hypothetical protein
LLVDRRHDGDADRYVRSVDRRKPLQLEPHAVNAGRKRDEVKTPRSFETAVCGRMSASLASVTETPGRTAFSSSVTTPVIVPVWICAAARDGADSKARAVKVQAPFSPSCRAVASSRNP